MTHPDKSDIGPPRPGRFRAEEAERYLKASRERSAEYQRKIDRNLRLTGRMVVLTGLCAVAIIVLDVLRVLGVTG